MTKTDLTAHNDAINAQLRALPALPGRTKAARAVRHCACGCGGYTQRTYTVGHDAKRDARVKRIELGIMTFAQLATKYGTPEIAKATAAYMNIVLDENFEIVTEATEAEAAS